MPTQSVGHSRAGNIPVDKEYQAASMNILTIAYISVLLKASYLPE
ncbi:hypothetical protein NBRC3188_2642 [Acetobacter pasteurianus NBRC 3188]|uniref:Uncharacterized protein n=1 Tax=Acetobacter pasteurianus NBRC 3188 TaxID=1226663 RepID=A0A401WXD9_ACEPA|nr:hypothetical protein NBRC3188_2642 [Acetobacter pasteurianus NBRC 3188]